MLKGHQGMLWLAGQVFLSRNFVEEAKKQGLDAIFAQCPYGLTESEKAAFRSAFENKKLRKLVEKWWKQYDEERESGAVTKVRDFWEG